MGQVRTRRCPMGEPDCTSAQLIDSTTCPDAAAVAKQAARMSHANAAQTARARLRVAQLVVHQGMAITEVAAGFQCSWPTVKRWAERYAAGEAMTDRSSRPHSMPAKTSPATTRRIVA